MFKINKILSKKIKSSLSLRGLFPFCHSRESGNPSHLSLRGTLSPVIARERSDRSNLNGFSLIELMVAAAILAFVVFGIFQAYSTGFMGMADAKDRTVATNYAREAMEDVKNMDFEKITTTTKSVINANRKYRVDVNVLIESENLKKVSTVVSWKDRNGIAKTIETSMLVHFIDIFASDAAKIVLFNESYNILNSASTSEYEEYKSTELTAVIKDLKGNTITDWGEGPNEGPISFSIIPGDIYGTLSDTEVTPINGRAYTTFTSDGSMSGNFGINVIEASVYLPDAGKTVTDTTTIKITNGPVKIILVPNPEMIKAKTTNYSVITASLVDAAGATLEKKGIFESREITFNVSGEGNPPTSTITIPFDSGSSEEATVTLDLYSTGNPGLASVVATATDLESGKTDVLFLGPPVAISISANPNPMYLDDDHSTISVFLIDENGFITSPSTGIITIILGLTTDINGEITPDSILTFTSYETEVEVLTREFSGQNVTGTAIITATGGGLPAASVTINVISALVPDHVKLTANPQYIKADGFELSTITAVVYDISGKIVTNYTGTITFETTLGNFSDYNFDNGIATVKLSSATSGNATITVSSSDSLDSVPAEGVEVGFYGSAHHIELNANPINVKIGEGNFSTITATVCDSNGIIVPEYIGNITFSKTLGTFTGSNPKTITDGIATIKLSSNEIGTAIVTVSSSPDSFSYVPADGVEVEFYEETALTLLEDTVQYDSENKVVTFDIEVTGENIEVDEIKTIWSDSSASQKLYKIAVDDVEVWSGNQKSGDIIDIINATLLAGESNISNIKITFGQDMAGRHIVVTFYPPVSEWYEIEFDVPTP